MIVAGILFGIFIISYNFLVEVKGIDSIPIGVETILILVFSFYFLYERMQDTATLFIYTQYSFWIVLGMMLYLSGSFFIYIYGNQIPDSEVGRYWIFTNIFGILKNTFFMIAILVGARQAEKKKWPQSKSSYVLN